MSLKRVGNPAPDLGTLVIIVLNIQSYLHTHTPQAGAIDLQAAADLQRARHACGLCRIIRSRSMVSCHICRRPFRAVAALAGVAAWELRPVPWLRLLLFFFSLLRRRRELFPEIIRPPTGPRAFRHAGA